MVSHRVEEDAEIAKFDAEDAAGAGRRALLVNLDFRDFIYSFLWGRAVLETCVRRNIPVDLVAVDPFVGRDLAGELGLRRAVLSLKIDGTSTYLSQPDEVRSRDVIGQLLEQHRYDTLILNCEASLFMHLMERNLPGARWLVYDRHLHVDLRAHDQDPRLRDHMIASGMHLFTIQEIATGGDAPPPTHQFTTTLAAGTDYIRSLKRLGLTEEQIHFQPWPMHDAFFAPQQAATTDKFVVFTGGDSGRDYATLFEAIKDLPVELRLCAANYPKPVPPNVTVLPRLLLHKFRDEVAQATVVVVPLTGSPPVSGITVVAMAKMMGKPVIASDNPVVRMHIPSHGEGGYLTTISDAALLRSLLMQLMASPAERQRLGQEARAQAARDLSLRAFVERMFACDERRA